MFDKIFGSGKDEEIERLKKELEGKEKEIENLKRKLKEEKEELKKKAERKEKKMEKERERAKTAVTEKQKSDKKLKEAKHKIESLKDRIQNLEKQSEEAMEAGEVKVLGREETLFLLDELEGLKSEKSSLVTHYIEDPEEAGKSEIARILRKIDSDTGYLYLKDQFKILDCILVPPFPVESEFHREERLKLDKIRGILEADLRVYFVSLHAGKSAVGLLEGPEFKSFDLISSQVKDKHSKGGFSQGRFERRREKQVKEHLNAVIEIIEDSVEEADYLVLDGNNQMKSTLKERFSTGDSWIDRSLGIGKVRADEKEEYAEKVWSSKLYVL